MKRRKIPDTQLSLFSDPEFMGTLEAETVKLKVDSKEYDNTNLKGTCGSGNKGQNDSKNIRCDGSNGSNGNDGNDRNIGYDGNSRNFESNGSCRNDRNNRSDESNGNFKNKGNDGSKGNHGSNGSCISDRNNRRDESNGSDKNNGDFENKGNDGSKENNGSTRNSASTGNSDANQLGLSNPKSEANKQSISEQESIPEVQYDLTNLFDRLARSNFRSSFHLKSKDRAYIDAKGLATIRQHAKDFVASRLAPAVIPNDGKQTPMRGHPVFLAQHATGCCCRGCFSKWHHIPAGRLLTPQEQDYAVAVLMTWITNEYYNR